MGFTVERVQRRVVRRGSEKGVSRRCLERPLEEYAPLGVHPNTVLATTVTKEHLRGMTKPTSISLWSTVCSKIHVD